MGKMDEYSMARRVLMAVVWGRPRKGRYGSRECYFGLQRNDRRWRLRHNLRKIGRSVHM